jgi:hypothetical protein
MNPAIKPASTISIVACHPNKAPSWHRRPPPPPILSHFSRQNKSQIFAHTAKPDISILYLY